MDGIDRKSGAVSTVAAIVGVGLVISFGYFDQVELKKVVGSTNHLNPIVIGAGYVEENASDEAVSNPDNNAHLTLENKETIAQKTTLPTNFLSYAEVEKALSTINVNLEQGLVLDENTLTALDFAMSLLPKELTLSKLKRLKDMIKRIMPGELGEEIAKLVVTYYQFKEEEFQHQLALAQSKDRVQVIDQLEEITTLREKYFGNENATLLFGRETEQTIEWLEQKEALNTTTEKVNDPMEFYLADVEPDIRDQTLEISAQTRKIRNRGGSEEEVFSVHVNAYGMDAAINIKAANEITNDWNTRYQNFSVEKSNVLNAGLSEEEKNIQIETLLTRYFRPENVAAARAHDIEISSTK